MSISLKLLGSINEHKGCINSIKFDSTGVYCMTAGNDRTIRLWNPAKKLHIKKFFGPHNYEVNDICLREDNKNFVSVGAEHSAFLWDTLEAKVIRKYNHGGKIGCCNFIWKNDLLVTGSEDKMVKIWDHRSRNPVQTFAEAKDSISCVNECNTAISASSIDGNVRHYDLRKGVLKEDSFTHSIISMAIFTAVPDCYIAASLDNSIKLVDNGTVLTSYTGHQYDNYKIHCTFDPYEKFVLSGSCSGDIMFWPIDNSDNNDNTSDKDYKEDGNNKDKEKGDKKDRGKKDDRDVKREDNKSNNKDQNIKYDKNILVKSAHEGIVTCISFSNPELLNETGKLKKDVEKNVRELILKQDNMMVSGGRDGFLKIWNLNYD